jgi:hypothetical protein
MLILYKIRLFLILILFILVNYYHIAGNNTLFAQTRNEAFSEIKIGLNISAKHNNTYLNDFWSPKTGFTGNIETPFYFGSITAGLTVLPFKSTNIKMPDYTGQLIFLCWGNELILPYNSSFYFGFKTGNYTMNFADDTVNTNLKSESEFAAGLTSRLNIRAFNNFEFNITGDAIKIFTKKKMNIIVFSAGLNYIFSAPAWLKEFLD